MFSSVHKYIYADWERFASKRSEEKKNTRKNRFSIDNPAKLSCWKLVETGKPVQNHSPHRPNPQNLVIELTFDQRDDTIACCGPEIADNMVSVSLHVSLLDVDND